MECAGRAKRRRRFGFGVGNADTQTQGARTRAVSLCACHTVHIVPSFTMLKRLRSVPGESFGMGLPRSLDGLQSLRERPRRLAGRILEAHRLELARVEVEFHPQFHPLPLPGPLNGAEHRVKLREPINVLHLRCRVDPDKLAQASRVTSDLGTSLPEVVRIFMTEIARTGEIPVRLSTRSASPLVNKAARDKIWSELDDTQDW